MGARRAGRKNWDNSSTVAAESKMVRWLGNASAPVATNSDRMKRCE
jgi:hypothetical protein